MDHEFIGFSHCFDCARIAYERLQADRDDLLSAAKAIFNDNTVESYANWDKLREALKGR